MGTCACVSPRRRCVLQPGGRGVIDVSVADLGSRGRVARADAGRADDADTGHRALLEGGDQALGTGQHARQAVADADRDGGRTRRRRRPRRRNGHRRSRPRRPRPSADASARRDRAGSSPAGNARRPGSCAGTRSAAPAHTGRGRRAVRTASTSAACNTRPLGYSGAFLRDVPGWMARAGARDGGVDDISTLVLARCRAFVTDRGGGCKRRRLEVPCGHSR